jgi:hypothetical protein
VSVDGRSGIAGAPDDVVEDDKVEDCGSDIAFPVEIPVDDGKADSSRFVSITFNYQRASEKGSTNLCSRQPLHLFPRVLAAIPLPFRQLCVRPRTQIICSAPRCFLVLVVAILG